MLKLYRVYVIVELHTQNWLLLIYFSLTFFRGRIKVFVWQVLGDLGPLEEKVAHTVGHTNEVIHSGPCVALSAFHFFWASIVHFHFTASKVDIAMCNSVTNYSQYVCIGNPRCFLIKFQQEPTDMCCNVPVSVFWPRLPLGIRRQHQTAAFGS